VFTIWRKQVLFLTERAWPAIADSPDEYMVAVWSFILAFLTIGISMTFFMS
jgi:hypothetical protein